MGPGLVNQIVAFYLVSGEEPLKGFKQDIDN